MIFSGHKVDGKLSLHSNEYLYRYTGLNATAVLTLAYDSAAHLIFVSRYYARSRSSTPTSNSPSWPMSSSTSTQYRTTAHINVVLNQKHACDGIRDDTPDR
ncbi:hypothetical protein F5B20DRAFT_578660 [Whalleya microplaca]|nr:hypothetical protein F5B20DRAFT_578660 [Whalleya microplaca]